jgi:hypothetical protein
VYSVNPVDVCSFDKTVTGVVGGTSYTFPAFNIWNISYTTTGGPVYTGPKTYEYTTIESAVIPAKGLRLFQQSDWQNRSGSLTIQIRSGLADIHYYVMVK